jgi:polysaccharide biosynthesis protein PslG
MFKVPSLTGCALAAMLMILQCTAASPRGPAFFGINADPVWDFKVTDPTRSELPRFVEMLQQTKCGAVRIPVRWRVVEPKRGEWDFSVIDRVVAAIPAEIEILAVLMSVPEWANGKAPGKVEGWFDAYPPHDFADWERAVAKIVGRYQSRIKHWEIWNEENGVDFYRPHPDARAYTELLKISHRAAKQADPQCVVVLGGLQMNGIIANPWSPVKVENFLEDLYEAGAGPFFDVCNIHPYVQPNEGAARMMALTRDTLAVMARHGDAGKPLWLTEVGCGATSLSAESAQARLLAETFELARTEPQIQRVFWFTLRDMEKDLLGPESSMGLFKYSGARKPAVDAFLDAVTKGAATHRR